MGKATTRRGDSDLANAGTANAGTGKFWEAETMVYCLNPDCLERQDETATNFCRDCGSELTLSGRYRAQSVVGESSFGRTLIATDNIARKNQDPRCIIKQLYKRSDSFERDTQRLQKLGEHPQIPALLNVIDNELGQFLVQELVSGDTLQRRIEEKGPLDEADVRSLLKSLLSVLEYVHSFKIIHRDIKPANILLQENKPPVLVDFGAAKSIRKSPAKTVIGSADYAAPEQSMGQATFASDLYSLGVTCLYALTSVAPFTLYSAAEDRWVWRDYLVQPVAPQLAEVLDNMVAQSLQQRFGNAQQVIAALKEKHALSFLSDALSKKFSPERFVSSGFIKQVQASAAPLADVFQDVFQDVSQKRARLQGESSAPANRPEIVAAQKWEKRYRIVDSGGRVSAIALPHPMPPRNLFATAQTDGSIHLWQFSDGQLLHTFPRRRFVGNGHSATITALCFHPDGRALYSASEDGTIKEWDTAEGQLLNTLPTQGWIPTDLKVTADGFQLISPNSDGQIIIWDIATLRPSAQLTQHQRRVNAVALSSEIIASASEDGTVKLWRFDEWQSAETRNSPLLAKTIKTGEHVKFLSFYVKKAREHDQKYLIVATQSDVQRYELDEQLNCSEAQSIYLSSLPITALALCASGELMLGSEDSILTIWDAETGDCVAKLAHDWGIVAVAASQNGQAVITASADEVITVWHRE